MRRIKMLVGAVAAVSVVAAGCGSSSHSASTGSGRPTYTIGLLTDLTGPAASGSLTAEKGLQAGIWRAQREGYNLKYVLADTQSSPTGALTAARKLVEENNVLAVVAISPLTVLAASFLTSHNVPVIGSNEDGKEWLTARNMFATTGGANTATEITTEWGQYMKTQGVTNMASVGYTLASSSDAATNWADSVKAEGIKVGYLNTQFPLGSTNVGPAVLQMKQAGINGLVAALAPNTGLAMVTALRQDGVTMKAVLLSGGYGTDLSQGGPGAAQAAQGVSFYLPFEPLEMHTAASEAFGQALRAVGVQGDPGFAEYNAYLSVDMLVQGLKAAGPHPTRAGLINALNGIHDYSGAGLFGGHTLNLGSRPNSESGVDHCEWYTKLEGTTYHLIPGAEPLCATVLPGKTLAQG